MANDIGEILSKVPFTRTEFTQEPGFSTGSSFWNWVSRSNDIVPDWWSIGRDRRMRSFWQESDNVSSALYNMQAKMVAIPFKISPRDTTIDEHHRQAELFTERLTQNSNLGEGWDSAYSRWVLDLLTQDNGAFMLILGDGEADGPILGAPYGVMHLDSSRCQRTRNVIYPVLYQHTDGKLYKIHYTRIMEKAQMPSPILEMNGVGFCAVSRMIMAAQHMMDIARYEMEKIGSRPLNALLVGKKIKGRQIRDAFREAYSEMDDEKLQRWSRVVAIGSGEDIDIKLVDLASVPDGFDKQTDVSLAMFTIALALGVDARELWPASASGATKADALVQHIKARGKGPGQIIGMVERSFDYKYLPPHLTLEFDYIDDEQDRAQAEIRKLRAEQRQIDLASKAISVRVARQQMLAQRDINDDQFEDMELSDGRLSDGTDVLLLFSTDDPTIRAMLSLGVPNILDTEANAAATEEITKKIKDRIQMVNKLIFDAKNSKQKSTAKRALAALNKLLLMYKGVIDDMGRPVMIDPAADPNAKNPNPNGGGNVKKPTPQAGTAPPTQKPKQTAQPASAGAT